MRTLFKITGALLDAIRHDLMRPHGFAAERVGFVSCRVARLQPSGLVILAHDYHPVADEDYLDDASVGAMMGPAAIRRALQLAFSRPVAMFHFHMHDHRGTPGPSTTDLRETAKFVPDFWNVRPEMPHGAIILSQDALSGRCWYPRQLQPFKIADFAVVGPRLILVRDTNGQRAR